MAQQNPKGKERKEARTTISLEPSLLIEFQTAAANNDLTVSACLRKLMQDYVRRDNELQASKEKETGEASH